MITSRKNKDIVYPAISATDKWYYDPSVTEGPVEYNQGFSVNLFNDDQDGSIGINYLSLKPAIKVRHIVDAIQEKYSSINFSSDANTFFGTEEFNNLYMLLHNNKGTLAPVTDSTEYVSRAYSVGTNNFNSDFRTVSGYTDIRDSIITKWVDKDNEKQVHQYHVIVTIDNATKSGGGSDPVYDLEILDGNKRIDMFTGVSGDNDYTSVLCTESETKWENINIKISSRANELVSYEMSLELRYYRFKQPYTGLESTCDISNFTSSGGVPVEESYFYDTAILGTQSLVQFIEITRNIPKMKTIDFLQGVFKMFNLTAIPQYDGSLRIQTLNKFYDEGNTIDITNKVNTEEIGVNRMDLFKNMEFKYSEPKTFGIINFNEQTGTDFGNLDYQSTSGGTDSSLIFDGKDYKVELPFEKLYYERLSCPASSGTTALTEFGHGWLADKDQNEVLTKPILFYNVPQTIEDGRSASNAASLGIFGFLGKTSFTKYNRPSNTNASQVYNNSSFVTSQGTKSINFNREFDEYTNTPVGSSLFRRHYENYISSIFAKGTRVFDLEMKADLSFLLKYKINDTLTIKGEEFLINNIRTNLSTGLTKLELVLKFFIELIEDPLGATISIPTNLRAGISTDSAIAINWDANDADEYVKGYRIYVDGSLIDSTFGYGTGYTITGLDSNTSYSIKIKAYSAAGDSGFSNTVTKSTTVDNIAPSIPQNLRVTDVESEFARVQVAWDASTDNRGVAGYEVFRDGVSQGTTTSTSFYVNATSGASHTVEVRAFDAVGNYSALSDSVSFRESFPDFSPLTNANFNQAITDILAQDVNGDYNLVPYGKISTWDVRQVTDMNQAFKDKTSFNGDLSGWDVSNVTNMKEMFVNTPFNQDIGSWDVSNVNDMSYMFYDTDFNKDIGGWNVANVETMEGMFYLSQDFNKNIGSWDVSSVENTYRMFYRAYDFNQDISGWNTSNVWRMRNMFDTATSFNQNLSSWNVGNVTDCANFDNGASSYTLSRPNFTSCTI